MIYEITNSFTKKNSKYVNKVEELCKFQLNISIILQSNQNWKI